MEPEDRARPQAEGGGLPSPEELLGKPMGRRIFLGLLGAGALGIATSQVSFGNDNVTADNVAQAVPLSSAEINQSGISDGVHPNVVTSERFRYYSVGYMPYDDPKTFRLRVDGEGANAKLSLSLDQLRAFPNVVIKSDFRCVTGWRVQNCLWRGVRVRDVVDSIGQNSKARFVTFYSGDGVYTDSLTVQQARSDHAILCWELNGQPLIREQGYPLRLIYPDMYGYKNVKWLHRVELKSTRDVGFWEQQGWDIDAYVYNQPGS